MWNGDFFSIKCVPPRVQCRMDTLCTPQVHTQWALRLYPMDHLLSSCIMTPPPEHQILGLLHVLLRLFLPFAVLLVPAVLSSLVICPIPSSHTVPLQSKSEGNDSKDCGSNRIPRKRGEETTPALQSCCSPLRPGTWCRYVLCRIGRSSKNVLMLIIPAHMERR